MKRIAEWLVDVGYPYDWSAPDHPLPGELRLPLAEAWHRAENGDNSSPGETVEDYLAFLAEEGGW